MLFRSAEIQKTPEDLRNALLDTYTNFLEDKMGIVQLFRSGYAGIQIAQTGESRKFRQQRLLNTAPLHKPIKLFLFGELSLNLSTKFASKKNLISISSPSRLVAKQGELLYVYFSLVLWYTPPHL